MLASLTTKPKRKKVVPAITSTKPNAYKRELKEASFLCWDRIPSWASLDPSLPAVLAAALLYLPSFLHQITLRSADREDRQQSLLGFCSRTATKAFVRATRQTTNYTTPQQQRQEHQQQPQHIFSSESKKIPHTNLMAKSSLSITFLSEKYPSEQ